jgi:hypothetical protein
VFSCRVVHRLCRIHILRLSMDERISLSPSFYHIHTIHWFPDIEVMGGPFVVYCFLNQPTK